MPGPVKKSVSADFRHLSPFPPLSKNLPMPGRKLNHLVCKNYIPFISLQQLEKVFLATRSRFATDLRHNCKRPRIFGTEVAITFITTPGCFPRLTGKSKSHVTLTHQ
jgi:hypothetical protein